MTRFTAALAAAAFASLSLATPADAARPAPGTVVGLTSSGCTFTATATWTRTGVTEVVLRLSKKEGWAIKHNGQLASTDLANGKAWATWMLSGEDALLGEFSASVDLYGAGGAAGQNALEQRRGTTKIRAACVLASN